MAGSQQQSDVQLSPPLLISFKSCPKARVCRQSGCFCSSESPAVNCLHSGSRMVLLLGPKLFDRPVEWGTYTTSIEEGAEVHFWVCLHRLLVLVHLWCADSVAIRSRVTGHTSLYLLGWFGPDLPDVMSCGIILPPGIHHSSPRHEYSMHCVVWAPANNTLA